MAIATYPDLQSSVATWLNRDDLTAQIPDFIALAEAKLNRQLRLRQMIARVTTTLDEEYEALPDDFLEAVALKLTTSPPAALQFVTPAQMDVLVEGQATGKPVYYTIKGDQFQFYPTPAGSPSLEMAYYAKIPALSDSNTTNFLLTLAPDVYLYATLLQSAPFLREDERLATWGMLYDAAYNELMDANQKSAFSAAPLVIRASVGF